MIRCDLIYLAWNRFRFTRFSFEMLLANTNWERVDRLVVYDDGSEDGTREWLDQNISRCPVAHHLIHAGWHSPVAVMNHYVETAESDWFAKIDNDIVCPPGWLDDMAGVLERNRRLEVLGMEGGRMGLPGPDWDGVYTEEPARHIGGVGLIKTSVLGGRRRMTPNGRYGWSEHQHEYRPRTGWISPDLRVCSLDQIPFDPWASLSRKYTAKEWQREWPPYFERWMRGYWDWWPEEPGA